MFLWKSLFNSGSFIKSLSNYPRGAFLINKIMYRHYPTVVKDCCSMPEYQLFVAITKSYCIYDIVDHDIKTSSGEEYFEQKLRGTKDMEHFDQVLDKIGFVAKSNLQDVALNYILTNDWVEGKKSYPKLSKDKNIELLSMYPSMGQDPLLPDIDNRTRHSHNTIDAIKQVLSKDFKIDQNLLTSLSKTFKNHPTIRTHENNDNIKVKLLAPALKILFENVKKSMSSGSDPLKIATYVARAVAIDLHPLTDCNGRTTRLLINAILISMDHPVIIFHDALAFYNSMSPGNILSLLKFLKEASNRTLLCIKKLFPSWIEPSILEPVIKKCSKLDLILYEAYNCDNVKKKLDMQYQALVEQKMYQKALEVAIIMKQGDKEKACIKLSIDENVKLPGRCDEYTTSFARGVQSLLYPFDTVWSFLDRLRPSSTIGPLYWIRLHRCSFDFGKGEDTSIPVMSNEFLKAINHNRHLKGEERRSYNTKIATVFCWKFGKWVIHRNRDQIDEAWKLVATALIQKKLGVSAKVSTLSQAYSVNKEAKTFIICVYNSDFDNKDEIDKNRKVLKDIGFDEELEYIRDIETLSRSAQDGMSV
ncbi:hypothetical protein AKO1_006781 [Acrasis kona]|uniref:Fido domain-containing protein n=1 Tax=Acrasis kona TaxID=1008807 RepID=A0AAW2YUD8_9EUKA